MAQRNSNPTMSAVQRPTLRGEPPPASQTAWGWGADRAAVQSPGAARPPESIEERIDDNDTHAYLEAEEIVLTPEQRERARDIAEDYREKLYDRREALSGPRGR